MASLRDIRTRIRSVKSTQQITKAMKLIAATRLRKAQDAILSARPYAGALDTVLGNLAAAGTSMEHPLMHKRPLRRVELIVMTADRGLCGGFNSNIIRRAQRFMVENGDQHEIVLSTVGRKGHDYFRKREIKLRHDYTGVFQKLSYDHARRISNEVTDFFVKGEVDAVYILYNEFISAISQRPVLATLLPIQPAAEKKPSAGSEYLYEPSGEAVLEALLPRYLSTKVYRALLESQAAFYGAQMSAMESATKNASELIGKLTLLYNRTRQAVITKELMEIVSGAEALK